MTTTGAAVGCVSVVSVDCRALTAVEAAAPMVAALATAGAGATATTDTLGRGEAVVGLWVRAVPLAATSGDPSSLPSPSQGPLSFALFTSGQGGSGCGAAALAGLMTDAERWVLAARCDASQVVGVAVSSFATTSQAPQAPHAPGTAAATSRPSEPDPTRTSTGQFVPWVDTANSLECVLFRGMIPDLTHNAATFN